MFNYERITFADDRFAQTRPLRSGSHPDPRPSTPDRSASLGDRQTGFGKRVLAARRSFTTATTVKSHHEPGILPESAKDASPRQRGEINTRNLTDSRPHLGPHNDACRPNKRALGDIGNPFGEA